jgi:biopolymer transport protein ExbD
MFFLLASFMVVSVSMQRMQTVRMNLPAAVFSDNDVRPDLFNIGIDKSGNTYLGKDLLAVPQIMNVLSNRFHANANLGVYVTGDRATRHGDVIRVLNMVRSTGVQKVAFAVTPAK